MVDLLKFNDFDEFIKKHKTLRVYYILLTYKEKREYKNFIYSLNYKEYFKDIIWEFFNEPPMAVDYVWEWQLDNLYKMYLRNKRIFNND